MDMGGQKFGKPSPKKLQQRPWFWPAVYSAIALTVIAVIIGFNALYDNQQEEVAPQLDEPTQEMIETATRQESMQYPFKESYVEEVVVLQDFYDMSADETTRENALLVFNQTFSTSSGVSIAINSEPFEIVAAMSGEIAEIKHDDFTGNSITIHHVNGTETRYSSITDILVKEGDVVAQGEQIATATQNEQNPTAGIHLHFEVLENGKPINPRSLLAF